ncbi:hypothetical protein C8R46DRAFT_889572 [Mycena filopes]|nr:hypothetical protein C8R46DRAFT_889572 [Mycena filopes]
MASDAVHDSGERYPPPKCHPETRSEILSQIYDWSSKTHPQSSIFWLHGPAGAGKSAVAQSFCQRLQKDGRLGASFFFKRGHASRGNARRLFPTIAYQLSTLLPDLGDVIAKVVENDPSVVSKAMSVQAQKLIVEPCREKTPDLLLTIVIDGLDECEDKSVQQDVLRLIGTALRSADGRGRPIPLRFLVAS